MSYSFGPDAFIGSFIEDEPTRALFSASADVNNMLRFERALVLAQAAHGLVPADSAARIASVIDAFAVDMDALRARFRRDGVAPPGLVAQLKEAAPTPAREFVHLGVTSQDLVDSSGMLACREAVALCVARLACLDDALVALGKAHEQHGEQPTLHARTRMQVALPISVAEKIDNWRAPLAALVAAAPERYPLQLGGPEGQYRTMSHCHAEVSGHMAQALGLAQAARPWHTDRAPVQAIAHWYAQLASVTGKIAADVLVMAQTEVAELTISGSGGSSAMPHKANPVLAEVVLGQARYAQTLVSGLGASAIHENERSGTNWTLEWMLLPALAVAAGSLASNTTELVARLEFL